MTGAHAPVRAIATGAAGEVGNLPSQSPNGDSVSAAASGAVCQWQTSSTDRRGSGDRPLGNVPPGRSGPEGGAKSRLPLWGRCPPREGGEGNPPPPRTCAILLMSTSGSELPLARIESPGTGPPAEDREMRQLPKKLGFMRVSQSISYETQ